MNIRTRRFARATAISIAFSLSILIPSSALHAGEPLERFAPIKVAEEVAATPGTVTWSPDGKRLAFIANKVEIYEKDSDRTSSLRLKKPYFVSWFDADTLLVLHGQGKLAIVEAGTRKTMEMDVPSDSVAAYPAWDGDRILVLTAKSETISFGVEVSYSLHLLDAANGSLEEAFSTSRILPRRYAGSDLLKGWVLAGPAPVSGEVMFLEFIVPPNAPAYIKGLLLDTFTGTSREVLSRYRESMLNTRGSWSPLGDKIALTDDKNLLKVLSLSGEATTVIGEFSGLYPAWDPAGGRIFLGGYLIELEGSKRIALIEDAPGSAAFFSPDGRRVALSAGGILWLLEDIETPKYLAIVPIEDIKKKVALLRELYTDGLLTEKEYRERLYAIISRQTDAE